jgi:hypothetical protein
MLFQRIYNYIEDYIDLDEYGLVEGGIGGYEGIYELSNSEYEELFVIYMPEYWSDDTQEGLNMKEKSPIIRLEMEFERHLNSMFGHLWEEPLNKFVKDNFEIEIKSINF